MTTEVKGIIAIVVVSLLILFGGAWLISKKGTATADPSLLIRSDSHSAGSSSAQVTLVEFGDYQCPGCANLHPVLKRVLADYGDKVHFVFRNFPLSQHTNATAAAQAAEAAGAEGKFWEMHDMLYEHQEEWAALPNPTDTFVKYAQDLQLNIDTFKDALQKETHLPAIRQDQTDGTNLGVNSTPTLFLNGQRLNGLPDYDYLKSQIDSKL